MLPDCVFSLGRSSASPVGHLVNHSLQRCLDQQEGASHTSITLLKRLLQHLGNLGLRDLNRLVPIWTVVERHSEVISWLIHQVPGRSVYPLYGSFHLAIFALRSLTKSSFLL